MNLTDTAVIVKKGVKIFLVVVVVYYIFILILAPGTTKTFRRLFEKPVPPNPVYGLLDPLEFVSKPVSNTEIQFVLNTKNGRIPTNIPDRAIVYKYKPQTFSYLAGKNALEDALVLGFQEGDMTTDLKGTTYKWRNNRTGGSLEIKTETRELKVNTSLIGKNKEFYTGSLDTNKARTIAQNLFKNLGRFDDGLYANGPVSVYLGKYTTQGIVETKDPKESQLARVDMFRLIDSHPILGPDPKEGLLHAIVRIPAGSTPFNNPIVKALYWEINPDSRATYPIISPGEAWNAIRQGQGVISNVTPKGSNPFTPYTPVTVEKILIDNIYIAYYDSEKPQKFLQPIYVFDGKYTTKGTEGGYITIYFPAIIREYTKQEITTLTSPK